MGCTDHTTWERTRDLSDQAEEADSLQQTEEADSLQQRSDALSEVYNGLNKLIIYNSEAPHQPNDALSDVYNRPNKLIVYNSEAAHQSKKNIKGLPSTLERTMDLSNRQVDKLSTAFMEHVEKLRQTFFVPLHFTHACRVPRGLN